VVHDPVRGVATAPKDMVVCNVEVGGLFVLMAGVNLEERDFLEVFAGHSCGIESQDSSSENGTSVETLLPKTERRPFFLIRLLFTNNGYVINKLTCPSDFESIRTQ
jgi:hypothetical protein